MLPILFLHIEIQSCSATNLRYTEKIIKQYHDPFLKPWTVAVHVGYCLLLGRWWVPHLAQHCFIIIKVKIISTLAAKIGRLGEILWPKNRCNWLLYAVRTFRQSTSWLSVGRLIKSYAYYSKIGFRDTPK